MLLSALRDSFFISACINMLVPFSTGSFNNSASVSWFRQLQGTWAAFCPIPVAKRQLPMPQYYVLQKKQNGIKF